MDTPENKMKAPFIEKTNGDLALKQLQDYHKAVTYYNKALFSVSVLVKDGTLAGDSDYLE
jgi:hypothetical protein